MGWPSRRYVSRGEFDRTVAHLNERMDRMTDQTAQLNDALDKAATDLQGGISALQAELDQIAAQHPQIDLSGAITKAQALDTAAQSLANLKPTPTPPAP